ncbi:MAG: TolC family protein [Gammaproteobacteria bacterium]|uniref:TolC family protein n=1 Tax=Thioalkalivibrio sp. TaxID=2093813 RepID=UPI0012D54F8D|nr:TolC family protein [Thioalkalivibrio sp.]TVP77130.1 MAG: TolC family protein [Thioalkalivibrio sp.]TVS19243.1 MAG: TolC family protein [Gammaproteobacteria bacterium]
MHRIAVLLILASGLVPSLAAGTQPYDPAVAVPEPAFAPLPPSLLPEASMGEDDWRSANDTVGAFTRGHIDIIRWEAENPPVPAGEVSAEGEPLSLTDAVRIALSNRSDLFATENMSRLERARADIAVVEFVLDVHRTWIQAVAAEEGLRRVQEAFEASEIATELALRMTRVGNWGQDRLLRQQLGLSDAGIDLAQARQAAASAREALIRKLGLWGDVSALLLPNQLPSLPDTPQNGDGLEAAALKSHPTLSLLAIEAERARRGLASRTGDMWNDAAERALSHALETAPVEDGSMDPLITSAPVLEQRRLPPGHEAARAAKAQAEAAALAVRIRSQVREAYHQYRVAYEIAQRAEENHRLSVELQDDMLLRYNGMLKSTWDLLASARDRVERADAAVQARRDFWLAQANLQAVLAGAEYPGADAGAVATGRKSAAGGH